MRAIFSVFFAGLLLAACGPTATFHRTGAPMALMENTLLDCKVEALGDAPVATQVRQGPPRYVPGPVYCPRKGQCTRGAGYFAPGEVYSVDTNARLRSDLINRCMARSGFQRVDLPRCAAGTPLPDLSAQSEGMPPLTMNSCLVKTPDGGTQIISPTG